MVVSGEHHTRRLCREQGIAALWATHLIDEVGEGARVVVLHKGEVRAAGEAGPLLGETRTPSMRAAFEHMVQHELPAGDIEPHGRLVDEQELRPM